MTSSAFAVVPAHRTAGNLGSTEWFLAFSLLAFVSLLPLRLLERSGTVATHWIHCAAFVALAALAATIVLRSRGHWTKRKHEPVDVPYSGGWSPDPSPPDTAVLSTPDVVAAIEGAEQPWVLMRLAEERQTGVAVGQLRVQHQLRDPVHHARMIVRDLESIGGPPDRLERVRSLGAHIDEIARAIGGGGVRDSIVARLGGVQRSSQEALS